MINIMSITNSVRTIGSITAISGVATIASSCGPFSVQPELTQGEIVNSEAQHLLDKFHGWNLISDTAHADFSALSWGTKLVYSPPSKPNISRYFTDRLEIFAQEGVSIPDPRVLDMISAIVNREASQRAFIEWGPRHKNIFVTGPNAPSYWPTTRYSFPLANTTINPDLVKDQNVDPFFVEFCQSLLSYDPRLDFGPDAAESLCNEIGIAAANAQNGHSYEEYLASHPEKWEFIDPVKLIPRTIDRTPFSPEEYLEFMTIFNPGALDAESKLRGCVSLSRSLMTLEGQNPREVDNELRKIWSKESENLVMKSVDPLGSIFYLVDAARSKAYF